MSRGKLAAAPGTSTEVKCVGDMSIAGGTSRRRSMTENGWRESEQPPTSVARTTDGRRILRALMRGLAREKVAALHRALYTRGRASGTAHVCLSAAGISLDASFADVRRSRGDDR